MSKIKIFIKELSKEIDSIVVKIGVLKIILVMCLIVSINFIVGAYFEEHLFKFHMIIIIALALSIVSLNEDSKIKYLGVWIGSIIGVVFSVVVLLMLVYGAGKSLIETVYGWFN